MPGIEINKKLVIVNSASSAVALVMNLSVLVWLQQYLLKRISPEEYSLIPLIMAVLAFTPLLTMVLTSGLGRYITVAYAKNDNEEITRICSTMFPILLGASLLFTTIGLYGSWHLDSLLDIPPNLILDARIMLALLVILSAVQLPLGLFSSGFLVRQKLVLQDSIDIGCQFMRIAILFSLLFGLGAKALWVTVAMVASEFLRLAIATPLSIHLVPSQRIRRGYFSWELAKELTGYGGWGFINQIGETFKQTMDPILLNKFSTAVELSMFNVAGIVPRQLQQILTPITRPFIPILSAMYATDDYIRLRNTYTRLGRYHAWVLLFFSVPVIVFNNELMALYLDGRYENIGIIMVVLLSLTILRSFNALGFAITSAVGVMKGIGLRMLALQVLNIILTVFFVVFLQKGALGSAFASLVSSLVFEIPVIWPFCRKTAHTPIRFWIKEVIFATIIPAVPSIIFCISFKLVLVVDSWLLLFSLSAISGLLYIISVILFGLREQDKVDIKRLFEKHYTRHK